MRTYLFLIFLVVALTGCASTNNINQEPEKLSTTHGYVMVNFSRDVSNFVFKNKITKKKYDLFTQKNTDGIWLPEGIYNIIGASNWGFNQQLNDYPDIEVKAGTLTNLGSLVNFSLGGKDRVWVQKNSSLTLKAVEQTKKKFSAYLFNDEVIEWMMTEVPEATPFGRGSSDQGIIVGVLLRMGDSFAEGNLKEQLLKEKNIDKFYGLAVKTLPPTSFLSSADKDGNLYFGGELGQIKKRNKDGNWESIDTGLQSKIDNVLFFNSKIFVLSGGGIWTETENQNDNWSQIFQVGNGEVIVDFDANSDNAFVLTRENVEGHENEYQKNINVYQAKVDNLGEFVKSQTLEAPYDSAIWINWFQPNGFITPEKYIVGIPNIAVWSKKLNSETWDTINLPGKFTGLNVAKNGFIALYNQQGIFSDLYLSDNYGTDWVEKSTPSVQFADIYFDDFKSGVAYRVESNFLTVGHSLKEFSPNAGKKGKWKESTYSPDECKRLLTNQTRNQWFCITFSDTIFAWKDGKWIQEPIVTRK